MQLNEDMLAQLRAAQEEAARLKKELAVLQQQQPSDAAGDISSKPRIDGTGNRETPWSGGKRSAWLSEADVDFFTGGGATESVTPLSAEDQATVGRRVAIGAVASLGLAAFALIPTKDLRVVKPTKPMFFYITQLLQAQAQLEQCGSLIEDAQWDSLRLILPRIKGSPTNAESALFDVIALLDASAASKAEPLAAEFLEYLDYMDYNKYFDAMPTRKVSGAENAEFVSFSGKALKSAQARLRSFLALLPSDQLQAAQQQVAGQEL